MAKKLAIEWDDSEIRIVAGITRSNRFSVTDVFHIDLNGRGGAEIGPTLAQALSERGLQKLPALVAIGRARAELRQLKLPPVPDDELPDVVRFQALRQCAIASERAAVDFLPIDRTDDAVMVAAAALAPEHIQAIRDICARSDLQLQRIVLRPTAAAALFQLLGDSDQQETILIDTLADEIDLVVMRGRTTAFLRSVRVPEQTDARNDMIVSELRRSLMAARSSATQVNDRQVIIWGRQETQQALADRLSQTLNIPIKIIDPFTLVDTPSGTLDSLPRGRVGRFAPLLGLLEGDVLKGNGLIDFLNPRKSTPPKSNRPRYIAYGSLAAAVVLCLGLFARGQLTSLDTKIRNAQTAISDLKEEVDAAAISKANLAKIDQFLDADLFALGELAYLSQRLAPGEQMQMEQLTITTDARGGATISVKGAAESSEVVTKTENAMRDERHEVTGDGVKSDTRRAKLQYTFSGTIRIDADSIRRLRTGGLEPESQPESQTEPKPESQTETKPESQTETKPESQTETKPESQNKETAPVAVQAEEAKS